MHIYYLKYNNYYNRKFKREASLPDYLTYEIARTENLALWNPADGIETSIVANIDIPFGAAQPDYAVLQGDTVDDYINSRWFIMEMVQLRKGQYRVSLRRDIIVDSIEVLEKTTNFLAERGFVEQSNKLVLQPENITVNRIKTKETLIKDDTKVPWIVGYLNRNRQAAIKVEGALDIDVIREYETMSDFEYSDYINSWYYGYASDDATWFALYTTRENNPTNYVRSWNIRNTLITQNPDIQSARLGVKFQGDFPSDEAVKAAFGPNTWIDDIRNYFNIHTNSDTQSFLGFKNKYIKVGSIYYKLKIIDESIDLESTINDSEARSKAPTIKLICEDLGGSIPEQNVSYNVYTFHSSCVRYRIDLEVVEPKSQFSTTIEINTPHLIDNPYDMFAIPYGKYKGFGDKEIAIKVASALALKTNTGATSDLYDLQLLPFAPKLSGTTTYVVDSNSKLLTSIYWATESTDEKTILLEEPIVPQNKKLDSIINLYRLVSPNYNGQFEFTAAANDTIYGFNVNLTYMPFNPYIRVAPIFGGLYGKDYSDARGLICSGDFSLPIVNSAWISYQQNNKNYNSIFNRNIESLEFSNNINRQLDIVGAVVGTVQGVASGTTAGIVKSPVGAVIGGAIGGGASAAGGIADVFLNERLRQEQLSLTRDLQRLNLGNIRAQPYSLTKTTPFTANNKIFPILEYYTCSPEEKELVEKFIENNSFNLGAVIPFKTLLTTRYNENARQWIQGRVVEFPNNFGEDYHFAATLNQELAQGYSFKEYTEV